MNRLYRPTHDRIIGGVAAGLADYFNVDPVLIRLLWVFSLFFGGAGFFAYLIAWIIIPEAPAGAPNKETEAVAPTGEKESQNSAPSRASSDKTRNAGLILIGLGIIFLVRQFIPYYYFYRFSLPVLLILLGFFFLIRGGKER